MTASGGCYCGAVRFEISGEPLNTAICHCRDCQKHSGSASVAWVMLEDGAFKLTKGELKSCTGEGKTVRMFCADCGTGIAYRNEEFLPGKLDIQAVTLDQPNKFAPKVRVQLAEQIPWDQSTHNLPGFDRFPPQD